MTLALQHTELYKKLNNVNNPTFQYLSDQRLLRDTWNIREDLPSLAEEAQIRSIQNILFGSISLPWFKDLTKLAVLVAVGNRRWGLAHLQGVLVQVRKFASWFQSQGYTSPSVLSAQLVQQWGQNRSAHEKNLLNSLFVVLHQLDCINFRIPHNRKPQPLGKSPQTIPERVKQQIDLALMTLDPSIYLIFKLHAASATRSIELAKLPLNCLRLREGVHQTRIRTGKQNDRQQEQDLPDSLVPLLLEHQVFVREKFGEDFPWLFPNWVLINDRFSGWSWPPKIRHSPVQAKGINNKLNHILKKLIENNDIRTPNGELAYVTTHMYRRTWATVADRMGKRPDQIMQGLRHSNYDMQDSYVNVSPQEQEKRTERVLVDNSGNYSVFRTDRDTEFLKKEWRSRQVELGVCTRPSIQTDCEYEYICLGCEFARYAQEHLPQLLKTKIENEQLLARSIELGQSDSRRANSARQYILTIDPIIASLLKTTDKEVFL